MVEVDCAVVDSPVTFAFAVAIQENVAPAGLDVRASPTVPPEQIVAVFALDITGAGFTVTVTVCGVPGQLPSVGVTVYVTVWTAVEVFVRASEMVEVDCAVVDSPVTFAFAVAIQENVAPAGLDVRTSPTVPPEQIVAVFALDITGAGFTVTVTVCGVPGQLLKVGVTV
jgi:hypothetical protein